MAINKNFVVKNGLEVSTELVFADADTRRVGIQNTQPQHTLHVVGGIGATNLTVSGVSTFSKPVGFGSDVDITGISTITGHVSIGKTTLLVVGDLDVTGNIKGGGVLDNITNLNISGIATVNEIYAAGGNISVGLLTVTDAADISGDANLTGVTTITNLQAGLATEFFAATGIQSGGVTIGGGVTTINFAGIGATLVEVDGTIANVYLSGGAGISSVGIETSGQFVGTATTINFIGPGVTVGVSSDNVAHVTVGLGSLGYTHKSFVSIGAPQSTFTFTYNRNAVEAYTNGVKLVQGSDFTADNGVTVSLANTALPGDTVEFVSYQSEIVSPLPGQILRRQFTANQGQTIFQFTGGYDIGNLDVFLNGSKLVEGSDFTATNGTSFTLLAPAQANDVLEGVTYPANIVGAGGSNFLFMDDDVPIGLASTINFGYGIGVTGFDAKVGIVTVGIPTNLNIPGDLSVGNLVLQDLTVPGNATISGITTMGNIVVGGATTELLVNGDARITGILTIGTSSITLDPSDDTVRAAQFVGVGTTAVMSNISVGSSEVTYLGIGTATQRSLSNRLGDFVSVKDYGATGDGVTDDAPAIKQAQEAATAAGKGLYFPSGTYAVSLSALGESLTMTTSWVGEGKYCTTILRKDFFNVLGSGDPGFIVRVYRKKNLLLQGITFDGQVTSRAAAQLNPPVPNVDPAAPGQIAAVDDNTEDAWSQSQGVNFVQCKNITVQDCDFKNFLRAGLRMNGGWPRNYQFTGTYSATGSSTITITTTSNHTYSTGDVVYVNFTSGNIGLGSFGTPNPESTYYTVTKTGDTTLTIENQGQPSNVTASGNVSLALYQSIDDEPTDDGNFRMSKNNFVLNCNVYRTRGYYGDSFMFIAVENLVVHGCYAYDYTRIAYVFEFSADYGTANTMPNKNVVMSDCISEFGHDAIQPENNFGVWMEIAGNTMFSNCSMNDTGAGYIISSNKFGMSSGDDGPSTFVTMSNCDSRGTKYGAELIGGTNKAQTININSCSFESNQFAAPYAYLYRGYPGNLVVRFYNSDDTVVPTDRRILNVSDTDLRMVGWTSTRYYGGIFVSHGESTSDDAVDRNTINITNVSTDWTTVGAGGTYIDNRVGVVTAFEQGGGDDGTGAALRYNHWGDLVVNGSPYTDGQRGGTSMWIGRINVDNMRNVTTGYVMTSLESRSQESEFKFTNTRMSLVRGSHPASSLPGNLFIANSSLVDLRANNQGVTATGANLTNISNSIINDATISNPSRGTIRAADYIVIKDCKVLKRLDFQIGGDASSVRRPLKILFQNNHFNIDIQSEGYMVGLSQGFPLYSTVLFTGNIFQHIRQGVGMAGTECIISMPVNALSEIYTTGSANVFDSASPHVIQYNEAPTYNDDPTTAAYPWSFAPIGFNQYFEGS